MPLPERTAVITGGASGLGCAATHALVEAGYRCLILDLDHDRGSQLASQLGPSVRFLRADVTAEEDVEKALGTLDGSAPLRVLVNCAFVGIGEKLIGRGGRPHTLESFRRSIEVNLIGAFNTMRLAAAAMAAQAPSDDGERGVIINVASLEASQGQVGQVAYAASKAALIGLMTPAARDLAPHGIRVMTIAPGKFATPAVTRLPADYQERMTAAALFPARLGNPEEFGRLAVHICDNRYLNAETIHLHAGTTLPVR